MHIESVAFHCADEHAGYRGRPDLTTSAITSAIQVMWLAVWPALEKLTCKLEFDHFIPSTPDSFSALRELHLTIERCNPSYVALISSLDGLETLHLKDDFAPLKTRVQQASMYWRADAYPAFATSLWAAIAGLPRLAKLHLDTNLADDEYTLAVYLNAPEGSFPSLQEVLLSVGGRLNVPPSASAARETDQFVRQFPRIERLALLGCDAWSEGMDGLPWGGLTALQVMPQVFPHALPLGMRDMIHLKTFHVDGATDLASLPEWIGELNQLTSLQISGSCIVSLPQSVTNLQHLRSLDISYSPLSRLPVDIGRMTALEVLDLDGCRDLTTPLPPSTAELANLTTLHINNVEQVGQPCQIRLFNQNCLFKFLRILPRCQSPCWLLLV